MSDHAELIARLEAAEAGSITLTVEVARACGYYVPAKPMAGWHDPDGKHIGLPPAFTTSLDAALALAGRVLPDGWTVEIKMGNRPFSRAIVHPKYQMENKQDRCPMGLSKGSAALAICIAILKAKGGVATSTCGTKPKAK